MSIPYRTRRRLERTGLVALVLLVAGVIAWFCWTMWLERYVVYNRDGTVEVDFSLSDEFSGEVAVEPAAQAEVSIYYNEGADAIETTGALTQLNGYYISYSDLKDNIAGVTAELDNIPSGTAVMIELKGGYGSFYYSSELSEAISSASIDVTAVDELIEELQSRGYYLIARISAMADYNFGLNHVSSGLELSGSPYLWMDDDGFYWLDPTDTTALGWITSIILELRDMGFHEVLLGNFRFPNSDKYSFSGDKEAALTEAAQTLLSSCAADDFVLSFLTTTVTFSLPEGRSRLYLENIEAANVEATAAQSTLDTPETRLVFLASTNDTRFSEYSVMHPITMAEVVEEQKSSTTETTEATAAG